MRAIAFKDSTTAARRKGSRTLRVLFMVLAFGFNLLLLLGAGLYFLNDNDYRRALIWSVDYFLESELEIDGAFSVKFGREVELSAETVRLKANDGSYDLTLGQLNVEQRFASYLRTGTLWINSLHMEDLHAEIKEADSEEEFDWQAFAVPFVVIEEIQLRNLSLAYTETNQQQHTFNLSHVSLDDTDNQGPVKVSAAGVINAQGLQLEGTLGSLEQLRGMNQTYPIELTLLRGTVDGSSAIKQGQSVIKLNGTVGNSPSGSIMVEADFDVVVPELVPIFSKEIVANKLGHLQGSVSIAEAGGRWRIRKTQFAATGTDAYQLRVDGAMENSGQFDLNTEFAVTDTATFGDRFGIDLTGYAPLKGKGLISGDSGKLDYQGKLSIGRIESEAALTASLVWDKPQIRGKLSVAELYLADIGINQRLAVPIDIPVPVNPDTGEQPKLEASASAADALRKASPDTGEQPKPEASASPAEASIQVNPDTNEQPESEVPAPVVDTSLTANSDVVEQPTTDVQASKSDDSQSIFDREPIDFTGLQHFNLDLELRVDHIIGEDFAINKLAGQVKLNDGALRISPMRMTFEGGEADLELALDTRNTPSVSLKVTADDLLLGGVVPHEQQEMQVTGKAQLHIDVNSKGRSAHELGANLTGSLTLGLADARLPRRYVEYLSGDEVPAPDPGDTYTMLEIDGGITAKFGSDIDLTAEAVHLRANDGSYDFTLGKLNLQQNIALFLEKGDLLIDNLSLADLHVEIIVAETVQKDGQSEHDPTDHESIENRPPEHDWHEFDWQVADLPFVLVKNMRLSNISVVYTEGDKTDTYNLSNLVLDNDPSEEPMTLSAAGMVNELALTIEGTVGTPAQPRGKNQIYPIDISLSSGAVGARQDKPVIKFTGTIDRTRPGGSRTEGMFDVAVSELVSIFKEEKTEGKLGRLQGSVDFAEVDGRWGLKKLDLDSSDTDLYQMHLDSEVDQADRLEVNSQVEIPDPPAFGAAFGIDLTGYAAYKGKAVLTGNRTQLDYKGQWIIGKTENDTTLTISLPGGKPQITGKFTIPNLYLPDIGINTQFAVKEGEVLDRKTGKMIAPEDQTPEDQTPEDQVSQDDSADEANLGTDEGVKSEDAVPDTADSLIVFAREPFDFSGLQAFNLDLEVLIDEITGVDFTINQLTGQVKLTDGVLRVSPMRLTFQGGTTDLDLLLDTHSTPSFTLEVLADDLELGKSIAELQEVVPVEGKAHLNVDISGKGHSPHEMAADLSGAVSFSLENAKIPKVYVEFLSADVFGWMARMVTFEDSYSVLHCSMISFDIDQGVAKSKLLFADGPQLSIEGDATLDLGQETIDMTLFPTQKKRVTPSDSTIKITGALADPDVETSTSKAGTAAVVGGALLVPQVVIPVFLVEQLWKRVFSSDESEGCKEFIAEHEARQQEAQQQEAEQQETE